MAGSAAAGATMASVTSLTVALASMPIAVALAVISITAAGTMAPHLATSVLLMSGWSTTIVMMVNVDHSRRARMRPSMCPTASSSFSRTLVF